MRRDNPLYLDSIDDPLEPAFHAAVSKTKKRAVVWHGTSTVHFWNIALNGLTFDEARRAWNNTTPGVYVAFSPDAVGLYASHAVEAFGGDMIFFVMEVPVSMLSVDPDDSEKWDKERKQQARSEQAIPPKMITGVVYPATGGMESVFQETPIRDFLKAVQRGKFADVEGLEPMPGAALPRYARATMEDEEHAVLAYLADLLNYSEGFFDHLLQPGWGALQRKVIAELQRVDRGTWRNWAGEQWISFVEDVVGEKLPEDDHVFDEMSRDRKWQRAFWELQRKYGQSEDAYREQRLGKGPKKARVTREAHWARMNPAFYDVERVIEHGNNVRANAQSLEWVAGSAPQNILHAAKAKALRKLKAALKAGDEDAVVAYANLHAYYNLVLKNCYRKGEDLRRDMEEERAVLEGTSNQSRHTRSNPADDPDSACECGSGLESAYDPRTKGFSCAECWPTVVEHEACGSAFYSGDGGVCDVCGEGAARENPRGARIKLTEAQQAAVEIYVTDPAHEDEDSDLFRDLYDGQTLTIPDEDTRERFWALLNDASNSADGEEHDRAAAQRMARSLSSLAGRVLRLTFA